MSPPARWVSRQARGHRSLHPGCPRHPPESTSYVRLHRHCRRPPWNAWSTPGPGRSPTHSGVSGPRPRRRKTSTPEDLDNLHVACREGRLYDVERWITEGRPLQLASTAATRRRRTTALGIALERQDHALVLLLLCNGYDPHSEPRGALDTALETRRVDLVDLLLTWGADPHGVDLPALFGTYDTALFERFYALGVDFSRRHALACALGYHSSNKPLFGFAKRHREGDPRIQQELDMALAQQASGGSEKGALLCLWAGADPHAEAPSLPYTEPWRGELDEEDLEDEDDLDTAVRACSCGHAELLERFGPDPDRDDFDALYRYAANAETVEVLARSALPTDLTPVVESMVESAGFAFQRWDSAAALRRLFELGARWEGASAEAIGQVRRGLLRTENHTFRSLALALASGDACSSEIRRELGRTGAFRRRLQEVRLMPKPGDRSWRQRREGDEMNVTIEALDIELPKVTARRRS